MISSWWRKLVKLANNGGDSSRQTRRRTRRASSSYRPTLEQFEDRVVPTTLSIPTTLSAVPGGTVQVPINIDNPNPAGSGGLTAATIAITYDPRVFTARSADVQLGAVSTGWSLAANVNSTTGQVGISLSTGTPDTSTIGGSLAFITLHVNPNATAGPAPINLDANNSPSGSPVTTQLTAAQGPLALLPPVTNGPNDPGVDGIVTIGLGLEVTNFSPSPTGFTVTFNHAVNPSTVNLYTSKSNPDDVLLTTAGTQVSIRGSLLFNADDTGFTFVKSNPINGSGSFDPSNGLLAPGNYTVELRSNTAGSSSGFQDLLGSSLDGSGGGFPGSNFVTTFSVAAPPVAVGIASFARGPSNTDAIAITGLTNGSPFTLTYTNPAASPMTATATITFSSTAVILQSNIQNALSNLSNTNGGLANQIGFNGSTPNSVVFVSTDNSSGANLVVVFQSALAQATNQLLVSSTTGVTIVPANINVANNIANSGIPIALSSGQNVVSGTFTLQYNPSYLTITGVAPNAAISAIQGASLTLVSNTINNQTSATAVFSLSSPTAIAAGNSPVILGSLIATEPMSAAGSYGATQLLHFSSEQLTGVGGPIPVTNVDGIQVVAFFGDVSGSGQFGLNDSAQIGAVSAGVANTAMQTIPGFSNYPNLDPVIIGDVSLQGSVNSTDAGSMIQELGGTARPTIPWAPLGLVVPPSNDAPLIVTVGSANQNLAPGNSANIRLGSLSDAGANDAPWNVTVNWGDSSVPTTFTTVTQGNLSQPHSFAQAGTYTVTVTVTNSAGEIQTSTQRFVVGIVSPTLTVSPANQLLNTGVSNNVSLGSFGDSGLNDGPWTVTVNWGDSTANTTFTTTSQGALNQVHSFAQSGTYTVNLTVINAAGGSVSASETVIVSPINTSAIQLLPPVGQTVVTTNFSNISLGSFSDSATNDAPWTVTVSWGDLTPNRTTFTVSTPGALSLTHLYANAGTYPLGVTVTNSVGASASITSSITAITPTTIPAVTAPTTIQTLTQGISGNVNFGSFSDTNTNSPYWIVNVNWGDSNVDTFGVTSPQTLALHHVYANPGTYIVSETVTNTVGKSGSATFGVTVVPLVGAPNVMSAANSQTLNRGIAGMVNLGSLSDSGVNDGPWTVNVSWGDSTGSSTFTTPALGGLSQSHSYANGGAYAIAVTVTNAAGASSTAMDYVTVLSPAALADDTAAYIVTPYDKIPNFGAHPTVISVQNGAWSNPSTWSTGVLPTTGDIVSIEPGTTVTYDVVSSAAVNTVIVQNGGQLVFRTDINTQLMVVNLLVLQGGLLQVGTQANPVAANVTAQIVFANQAINTTTDPGQYGNGLIALGTVTMFGAVKSQTYITISADAHAGDTVLQLSKPAAGWQAGDQLFVPDTRQLTSDEQIYYGGTYLPQWELVTIASISANGLAVTLTAPLQYDHLGAYDGNGNEMYLPQVADLTRNVKVHSQSATGTRGYAMFTYQANVNIQYVSFGGLGRTTSSLLDDTDFDANGNVTHIGANQQDRTAIQFQDLFGPANEPADGYQYTFVGNSVFCPLTPMTYRWGIAINNSDYGLIQENVVENWNGAGIVTEQGNESFNVIDANYVARITGTIARADARVGVVNNDWGTEGSAFWLRGFNNYVTNNVAVDSTAFGFTFYAVGVGVMEVPLGPGADLSAGQYKLVNINDIPILQFTNNSVYGATAQGLTIWSLGTAGNMAYGDASVSVVKDFTVWHVYLKGYYSYEVNRLTIDGMVDLGDFGLLQQQTGGPTGIDGADYFMDNFVLENSNIQGMRCGIAVSTDTSGTFVVQNTYLRDYGGVAVVPMWTSAYTSLYVGPRQIFLNNVTFAPAFASDNGWGPQYFIWMGNQLAGNTNMLELDQVFVYNYNGIAGNNFQVYYNAQAANAVVMQTTVNSDGSPANLASPLNGLTNAQLWAQYGIAVAGGVAPTNATTESDIFGLVVSI
jgi:PKD repeat protein